MPKVKTKKAAEKRFKITKKGKILRRHQMASHLKIKKRKYRIYRQKRTAYVSKANRKKVGRLLPYA
jgi:large subunit ribosomal protein L35